MDASRIEVPEYKDVEIPGHCLSSMISETADVGTFFGRDAKLNELAMI